MKTAMITQQDIAELINLYHLARTALSHTLPSRYDRLSWAAQEYHKTHPDITATRAYKELDYASR